MSTEYQYLAFLRPLDITVVAEHTAQRSRNEVGWSRFRSAAHAAGAGSLTYGLDLASAHAKAA